MKIMKLSLVMILPLLMQAAYATSPLEGLKFQSHKTQIMKDLKHACKADNIKDDNAWLNAVLAIGNNKNLVQSASNYLAKNDQKHYQKTMSEIQCPK